MGKLGLNSRATDPTYLRYQYGNAEKLWIRQQAHRLYSERPDRFWEWIVGQLDPRPGVIVLDVGCGSGAYHPLLQDKGVRTLAGDLSLGMLEEVRRQAKRRDLAVEAFLCDAQALPLADACCDRVMANHMLYHVPDQARALREMRRVLAPGGRIVLSTASAQLCHRLFEIHDRAARALGYTPAEILAARFTLDDLALVRSVFPSARREILPNAFVFPTADAVLQYYASGPIDRIREWSDDGEHRGRLLARVAPEIEAIVAGEGAFRDSKTAGCFVADV